MHFRLSAFFKTAIIAFGIVAFGIVESTMPQCLAVPQGTSEPSGIAFQIKIAQDQVGKVAESGRVLVGIGPKDGVPNFTNYHPPVLPILGVDVKAFAVDEMVTLNSRSTTFPVNAMEKLPAGEYTVQAIFATNPDINLPIAPGNRFSAIAKVKLDPSSASTTTLVLDKRFKESHDVPDDTATHKYLSLPSKLLSDFFGRPMAYRVAIVLPENYEIDLKTKYGLAVHIGGFGTRYGSAKQMKPDSRFVQILPDGAGPFGDPYQVDSDNNGPYGQAFTTEVIPFIEKTYRCFGTPKTRFTTGGSTGGWVSLALQLYYPEFFNGCWSQCPDSLTFERYELIDLYGEPNAYVNKFGFDRPSTRTIDGDTVSNVRHEVQLEKALGLGSKWELSGRDWASWNAVYGPKGANGLPIPVWDGETGTINQAVAEHWRKHDLKIHVEKNWRELGPQLAGGKVNIWVGDSDEYFLNAAVRRFKDSMDKLENPKFDGTILIEARRGHEGGGWSRSEILDAMAARMK